MSLLTTRLPQAEKFTLRAGLSSTAVGLVLTFIALVAFSAILLASSRWGIGVVADSTVYIGAARSLLFSGVLQDISAADGPIPLVHVPPLLPALLAGVSALFQTDPISSVRWLNAILFGVNTALLGMAAWRFLNSPLLGLAAALLALVATPMVDVHLVALSEPLYLFLSLSALLLLTYYLQTLKIRFLVLAGTATAVAFLTRYAGSALVAAGFFALLIAQRKRGFSAVRHAFLFVLISSLPIAAWFIRNLSISGSVSDYSAGGTLSHFISVPALFFGINTTSMWILPGFVPERLRIALVAILVLALAFVCLYGKWMSERRARPQGGDSNLDELPTVCGCFIFSNLIMLFVTISLSDQTTRLDDRILLPLFGPAILLLLWNLKARRERHWTGTSVWILTLLIVALTFTTNSVRSAQHVLTSMRSGRGYGAKEWRSSHVVRGLQTVPSGVTIYTTLPSSVRFLTGRTVRLLPNTYNPRTGQRNEDYGREVSKMWSESKTQGIALLYFKGDIHRPFPSETEIRQMMDLQLVASDETGALYFSPALVSQTP